MKYSRAIAAGDASTITAAPSSNQIFFCVMILLLDLTS